MSSVEFFFSSGIRNFLCTEHVSPCASYLSFSSFCLFYCACGNAEHVLSTFPILAPSHSFTALVRHDSLCCVYHIFLCMLSLPCSAIIRDFLSRLFPSQLALCPYLCILLPSSIHPALSLSLSLWLLLLHFGQSVCRSVDALSPFPRTFWKYHKPSGKMKAAWGNKTNSSTCMCSSMCEFAYVCGCRLA